MNEACQAEATVAWAARVGENPNRPWLPAEEEAVCSHCEVLKLLLAPWAHAATLYLTGKEPWWATEAATTTTSHGLSTHHRDRLLMTPALGQELVG